MVGEIASDNLLQPSSLFGDWLVHPLPQFSFNLPERCPHTVASGLPLKQKIALARFSANEGETKEVEGLRFVEPALLTLGRREAAELDQPIFSGCSVRENSRNRSRIASQKRRASVSRWKPTTRSSA